MTIFSQFNKGIILGFTFAVIIIITIQQFLFLISNNSIDKIDNSSSYLHGFKPTIFKTSFDNIKTFKNESILLPNDNNSPITETNFNHVSSDKIKPNDNNNPMSEINFNDVLSNKIKPRKIKPKKSLNRFVDNELISSYENITNDKSVVNTNYLSRQQCEKLGSRRFLDLKDQRMPPMLYTFPGSGNTWCRLLIEHATKIFTGSVYNDKSLLGALPGEFSCNQQVSVVKVHPHTHGYQSLFDGTFHSDGDKCARGKVKSFKKAILLIRDPFDSIWSEYQRRVTSSHVEGILKRTFDWSRWQANAAALSHSYFEMWDNHYSDINKLLPKSNVLYIKYEDLKNKTTQLNVLNQIVRFINIANVTSDRLKCAFVLAENKKAHRLIDKDIEMTKDIAYTMPLACRMWNLFGNYARGYGYKPFNDYNCTGIPIMPKGIKVGPAGQYDKKWVSPGDKLIDFGEIPSNMNNRIKTASNGKGRTGVIRPSKELLKSFRNKVVGMTPDEAMSVNGIAKLGETSPVW